MQKQKTQKLLDSLVIVVGVALFITMCVGVFIKAEQHSAEDHFREEAVLMAQNGAEALKEYAGDLDRAAEKLEGVRSGNEILVESNGYSMVITLLDSEVSGLGQAEICVSVQGVLIFTLKTGWQNLSS